MIKKENCTSPSLPSNSFRSYEIIIISDVVQTDNGYSFTQNIYNPYEYEEYKLNESGEKDGKIQDLQNKLNTANVIINKLNNDIDTALLGIADVYEQMLSGGITT
jgi:hypothetical protein